MGKEELSPAVEVQACFAVGQSSSALSSGISVTMVLYLCCALREPHVVTDCLQCANETRELKVNSV